MTFIPTIAIKFASFDLNCFQYPYTGFIIKFNLSHVVCKLLYWNIVYSMLIESNDCIAGEKITNIWSVPLFHKSTGQIMKFDNI